MDKIPCMRLLPQNERTDAVCGLTLIEVLVAVALTSIIVTGLYQVLANAMMTYETVNSRQDTIGAARAAMERMVMFAGRADAVETPGSEMNVETLKISERVYDMYDNTSHAFAADGDRKMDADNDGDGLINEDTANPDILEWVEFTLDKTDAGNWRLTETLPDYSTADVDDTLPPSVICDRVTAFACNRVAPDVVEINLTVDDGEQGITLKTRAKSRWLP
ncbi:MAG: prepilin-type N-terminal cleavage/methylation domain-containing protein [Desulfobacteraceae bacterium]|nr:prepilin-type N-terminal cleavage/methylation domain-containing protein [Desulfobacteraceae bacterium]